MNRKLAVLALSVGFALTGCNGGQFTPSDDRPTEPKKIAKKAIDPAHYKNVTKCVAKNKRGSCIRTQTTKKETDDKDWLLITSDGTTYDVTEAEYNSVNVGDWWNGWEKYGD